MPLPAQLPSVEQEEGIGSLFSRLIDAARDLARAELRLGRQVMMGRVKRAGVGIGLAAGAVLLTQSALTALLVGLVIALAPLAGALGATLIVFAGALVAIAGLGLAAKGRLAAAFSSEDSAR